MLIPREASGPFHARLCNTALDYGTVMTPSNMTDQTRGESARVMATGGGCVGFKSAGMGNKGFRGLTVRIVSGG